MRPRFLIFIFFVVLLTVAFLFWRRPVQSLSDTKQPQAAVQPNNALIAANTPAIAPKPILAPLGNPQHIVTFTEDEKLKQAKREIESVNLPIDLYGLVIDQDSNPIAGVKIKSGIRHWAMPDPNIDMAGSTDIVLTATTGTDGRFELTGATGDGFGVLLTKDGYDAGPDRYGFGGGTSGNYENPVIFKMWSTNFHEPLITGNKSFEIVPDGRSYFINLTDGTISESTGGDLRVWIQYTNQVVVPSKRYDWSAGIEAVNGGLLEVPQPIMNSGFLPDPPFAMYSAPANGYIPSFSLKGQIRGGQDGEIENRYFYLLLNGGKKYGRMSINLFAPYGHLHPGLVRISYAINPSGSRILR